MKKNMHYVLILGSLLVLLAGCGNSTRMVVDTESNNPQAVTIEANNDADITATESTEASDITYEDDTATQEQTETINESDTSTESTEATGSLYSTVTPDNDGNIVIDKNGISSTASYYNYQSGDTIIQLIGIATESGEKRIAFNTCQSCNPSPLAYYKQQDDLLICQNCGFEFTPADVGAVSGGCNPMPIEQLSETDSQFVIPAAYLDTFVDVYASWTGPIS